MNISTPDAPVDLSPVVADIAGVAEQVSGLPVTPIKSIQRGESYANGLRTVTISSVDMSKAFVNAFGENDHIEVYLESATAIKIRTNSTTGARWQVIEYV